VAKSGASASSVKLVMRELVPPAMWKLAKRLRSRLRARSGVGSARVRAGDPAAVLPDAGDSRAAGSGNGSTVGAGTAGQAPDPATSGRFTARTGMPEWDQLTQRTLNGLAGCDPDFRPTSFWGPGLSQLLTDMSDRGLDSFKSWPTSGFWFYPGYGSGFTNATIDVTFEAARKVNPRVNRPFLSGALNGGLEARRDFDAARLFWDQTGWPADLEGLGESRVGKPPQFYRLTGSETVGWGRPYLNYLLCLAALSRHVSEPPASFLEIGGGFGVLGEIVLERDPQARYVNLDIPPLLSVSSYYLTGLFGRDRVMVYDDRFADSGPVEVPGSACLPNWRIEDLVGDYDVFVNSFSFQEMEPHVVQRYVDAVARIGVRHVVSLNSRLGKPKRSAESQIGVIDPVTSQRIVEMFGAHGYQVRGRYGDPLIRSAGELVVLSRS
jgi:putative sugar O-methyltransferase